MKGKICLVTGASAGIGKYTCLGLAEMDATVLMVVRNLNKGESVIQEIRERTDKGNLKLLHCDLADQGSIRKLAEKVNQDYPKLDVLINNAGVVFSDYKENSDGFEMQWAVNHLAPFLLTNLLLDKLKASAPSRIITVSSDAHKMGKLNLEDPNQKKKYNGWNAYGQSKLANILFTKHLSKMLEGTGVTSNCLHPGGVSTNIGVSNASGFLNFVWTLLKPFLRSLEKGAETPLYLASSEDVANVSGDYFYDKKQIRTSDSATDPDLAAKLWDLSLRQTGLVHQA